MNKVLIVLALIASAIATPSFALSAAQQAQLSDLLQKREFELLGAPPNDGPYDHHYDMGHRDLPPPGCKNPQRIKGPTFDPQTNRWFSQWHCDGAPPHH